MISEDIDIRGFDAVHWLRLLSLFVPSIREPGSSIWSDEKKEKIPEPTSPGTLIISLGFSGQVVNAFHSQQGLLQDVTEADLDDLDALANSRDLRRIFVLRPGALDDLSERLVLHVTGHEDYLTQWLALLQVVRDVEDSGLLTMWPESNRIPLPSPEALEQVIELLLPNDHSALAVLWDGETIWTSVVVTRRQGELTHVVGPETLTHWSGPLGGDWRRDYRVLVRAVEHNLGPVHLGCFGQKRHFRKLLAENKPGSWAKSVATRDLLVHPYAPYSVVALGADAVRGAASQTSRFFGRLEPLHLLGPVANALRNRMDRAASVTQALGFNPLDLLSDASEDSP